MVGNYFEAQDLTQETFLAAWRNLGRFDGRHEKAWLCRIAANKCTDFLRQRQTPFPEDEQALLALTDNAPDPERQVIESEVRQELRAACLELKEPYRSVALAHFVEERSAQEIARQKGENLKTVQTRIYRARDQLKILLGKERVR